ncbi:MAG: aspartate carbamoyltransferase [Methylomonas lenta]|nr:aspartate carbamoyltransferase [Methylomonas lenta]
MKVTILMFVMLLSAATAYAEPSGNPQRQEEVAVRGRHVMPFDLEKTLHIFEKNPQGGVQQVIVKDTGDSEQINLIRRHLSQLAKRFTAGDFAGPRHIHGDTMPGVQALANAGGKVHFLYRALSNGAEIEYVAEDSALIDAIHQYFDAQLNDHARHAVDGKTKQCLHETHQPQSPMPSKQGKHAAESTDSQE